VVALIPDPLDELADLLARTEDVLRFAEVAGDALEVLDAAAEAAGALGAALRRAFDAAPRFVAADGVRELGVVVGCPEVGQYLPAILAGVAALPRAELARRVPGAGRALERLRRSVAADELPSPAATDGAVAVGTSGSGVVVGMPSVVGLRVDQAVLLGRWPSEAGGCVVLTEAEEAAYRRLVAFVVEDSLERFAAG
jgi:hypothetical protein